MLTKRLAFHGEAGHSDRVGYCNVARIIAMFQRFPFLNNLTNTTRQRTYFARNLATTILNIDSLIRVFESRRFRAVEFVAKANTTKQAIGPGHP